MGKKDPRIDAYIAKSKDFAKPILEHIRDLVHKACPGVEETIKWGVPSYEYKGPYCMTPAFKEHCAVVLWKARLMKDPALVENAKSEVSMGHLKKISSLKDLPKDKVMLSYLKEAAKLNADGVKNPPRIKSKEKTKLVVPQYFLKALKTKKRALEIFKNFTSAKKKEYVDWVTEAKTEETRNKRISTSLEWIAEGKTRNWKYTKK
jgi:uncharacterized protein YdeI (YjbR/CyaY-like superfamily)